MATFQELLTELGQRAKNQILIMLDGKDMVLYEPETDEPLEEWEYVRDAYPEFADCDTDLANIYANGHSIKWEDGKCCVYGRMREDSTETVITLDELWSYELCILADFIHDKLQTNASNL